MDNESKQAQMAQARCKAYDAIDTLTASRRAVCAEHNERIRKLRDFAFTLAITSRTGASDLFDIKETLSPEMARLLDAPTHDLWNGGTP
jgi:hypothetical protein